MRKIEGTVLTFLMITALWCAPVRVLIAQDSQLRKEFITPPNSAKPRVWWHWMNGNVTEQGIKLDLEWMRRVGIGGVQAFDASIDTPQVVPRRLEFMTSQWNHAFVDAVTLANQLGLEFSIPSSPGFSESGGPWVKPAQGMKKIVWRETPVESGTTLAVQVPLPPRVVGPFQDVPVDRSDGSRAGPTPLESVSDLYRDIALIAYRLPDKDKSMTELNPVVTTSAGEVDTSLLWDGSFTRAIRLKYGDRGAPAWIQVDFGHLQTVQSMTIGLQDFRTVVESPHAGAELESSADGSTFEHVAFAYDTTDLVPESIEPVQETVTFVPVTARYFRVVLPEFPPLPVALASFFPTVPKEHQVTEFVLHPSPFINHFEQKAGYFIDANVDTHPTPHVAIRDVVDPRDFVDLTSRLRPDGTLDWVPPAGGHWAILRIGYSLLGVTNESASPEATGLEVDKLSSTAVKAHMDDYLDRITSILGPDLMGPRGLHAMVNDSWEAGAQNWTDELPTEFLQRRGYDLHLWLPALTGRIVGSAEATDRFLWDFRRTLQDLVAEKHYGQITASLHARGMIHYGESHEISRAFIGDGMDAKRGVDIPMGAMWMPGIPTKSQQRCDADIRESASVAHIYGQRLVAAESLTAYGAPGAAYAFAPEDLKPTVDRELADGVNLFVLHTSAHQPEVDRAPGVTMGPFGQWFTRHETWAEEASPWITYLARSAYLLQQGRFVADIVYYYGQDSNITALYGDQLPPIPDGYAFDFANDHALTLLSVRDGNLVTASGANYRLLVLDPRARVMSLDVLRTIARLVKDGATVIGDKPQTTPSLSDNETDFRKLADSLWGARAAGMHRYEKGRVISGRSLQEVLTGMRITPDFSYNRPEVGTTLWFVHRRLEFGDLYFLDNATAQAETIQTRFRIRGKAPELWHADTGVMEPAPYIQEGSYTTVPLTLGPHDAVFIVFLEPSQQRERRITEPMRKPLNEVFGPWEVEFQPGRGAPDSATFDTLHSLSSDFDPGIKYFSGTARYNTSFNVPVSWLAKDRRVEIDLGQVKNVAEVFIGGKSAGIAWKAPYRVDITEMLHPGINRLTVRVTNLWQNRLIGDKQPNSRPVTFTTFNPYSTNSPLSLSGLLGPVMLLEVHPPPNPLRPQVTHLLR